MKRYPNLTADRENYKQYAFNKLAEYGWSGMENSLNELIMGESGWDPNIHNPTSTAYGIGQFLNSTWKPYGQKTSDPYKQIDYTLHYIKDRYGNPTRANIFKKGHNWYEEGGTMNIHSPVDDAVIAKNGTVVPISPNDNVVATKSGIGIGGNDIPNLLKELINAVEKQKIAVPIHEVERKLTEQLNVASSGYVV
jgi:hypothetical protein